MLRYGTISSIDADKGLARVQFGEDEVVSDWLPVLVQKTMNDKYFYMPDVNEHVACLMEENGENGIILGAIYSQANAPGVVKGEGKSGVEYENGDIIEYDHNGRILSMKIGTTEFRATNSGPAIKTTGESLKQILLDLMAQLKAEYHMTGSGPTTVPVNVAAYTAIEARINAFFES